MVLRFIKSRKRLVIRLPDKPDMVFSKSRRTRAKFEFSASPVVTRRIKSLLGIPELSHIDENRIFCIESTGSKSRAYARIWGLARIWQETLKMGPAYVIEVTHRFEKLREGEQDRVLLHELAHIPKNFSGALLGHNGIGKRIKILEDATRKK